MAGQWRRLTHHLLKSKLLAKGEPLRTPAQPKHVDYYYYHRRQAGELLGIPFPGTGSSNALQAASRGQGMWRINNGPTSSIMILSSCASTAEPNLQATPAERAIPTGRAISQPISLERAMQKKGRPHGHGGTAEPRPTAHSAPVTEGDRDCARTALKLCCTIALMQQPLAWLMRFRGRRRTMLWLAEAIALRQTRIKRTGIAAWRLRRIGDGLRADQDLRRLLHLPCKSSSAPPQRRSTAA